MASYDDTATVSGSVVGFSNGADSVPLKNWLVTLPASLDGYTEVNGTKAGKNLASGGVYEYNARNMIIAPVYLRAGIYTVSFNRGVNVQYIYIRKGETVSLVGDAYATKSYSTFFTFTADEDTYYFAQLYRTNTSDTWEDYPVTQPQIEVGSTATAYEAYEAPTQYTASLGRTIYGGTPDLVNGTGTENCTNRNLVGEGFTWVLNTTDASFPFFTIGANAPNKASNKNFVCEGYVNNGNYRSLLQDGEIGVFNNTSGINRFCVRDDSCTTLEQFLEKNANTKITYEVTTPTSFTFDPVTIETAKGSNTFWSDQGNTELTYYKDGYGFTSVTVHKETPEGEPVEETRKLHRIIYEGQVDVINGTGLIYRGESGTQYDPPEQISFTPIEVSTDEGENTLYADQGDSAITYRKAVD